MRSLSDILCIANQPKRAERYLRRIIAQNSAQSLEANNLLATLFLHQNRLVEAIHVYKQTIGMQPESMESIWAMKMLSYVYRRLGFKGERCDIEFKRLRMLRKLLQFSNDEEKVDFATRELKREFDERDILSTWGYTADGSRTYFDDQ